MSTRTVRKNERLIINGIPITVISAERGQARLYVDTNAAVVFHERRDRIVRCGWKKMLAKSPTVG